MRHDLKTWPRSFARVASGEKRFEIRHNDRDYQAGDLIVLHEWDPDEDKYSGAELTFRASYISSFDQCGDNVVIGLEEVETLAGPGRPGLPSSPVDLHIGRCAETCLLSFPRATDVGENLSRSGLRCWRAVGHRGACYSRFSDDVEVLWKPTNREKEQRG